jgi:cystathionine beta-lyase/cystathionine gamma-synthase
MGPTTIIRVGVWGGGVALVIYSLSPYVSGHLDALLPFAACESGFLYGAVSVYVASLLESSNTEDCS